MLENTTIVIPTFIRHPHLLRLLKFINSYGTNLKILILDSTPEDPNNIQLIKLLSKKEVNWVKFDYNVTYWERVARGSNLIETDYAVLCADDDFIIPTAVGLCTNFLDENLDYVSANGLYFTHPSLETYSKYGFAISEQYKGNKSAEQESANERVHAYLSGKITSPRLYAVYRAETLKLIWRETAKYTSDWGLAETFPCSLSYILGKAKNLPVFYSSREPNETVWYNKKLLNKWYSNEKVEKAINGLAKHLCKMDNVNVGVSKKILRDSFELYLNKLSINRDLTFSSSNYSIWKKIKLFLKVRYKMQTIFYKGCHPSIYTKYFDDYKKVRYAVLKSGLSTEELNISRRSSLLESIKT